MWLFEALAEPTRIGGVSGLSRNVNILCLDNNQAATVFWIINGSVYGLLQVPDEFILCKEETCDLKDLTISVLQSEMDGYTFQCVGIDYNTNTHHLGRQAELSVTTLPQGGSFNGSYVMHAVISVVVSGGLWLMGLETPPPPPPPPHNNWA